MHLLDRRDNPSSEEGNTIHCLPVCLSKYVNALTQEGSFASFLNAQMPMGDAHGAGRRTPPPKLRRLGVAPPLETRTAQYLNSGIFPNGSNAGFVSMFAAAS